MGSAFSFVASAVHSAPARAIGQEAAIVAYMDKHPQRANFAPLLHSFGLHGHCIEVGVAAGRYSELLLVLDSVHAEQALA